MRLWPKKRVLARPEPLRGEGPLWTCHFCGDLRLDKDIAVAVTQRMLGVIPVKLTHRYCRDKKECRTAAARWVIDADAYGRVP